MTATSQRFASVEDWTLKRWWWKHHWNDEYINERHLEAWKLNDTPISWVQQSNQHCVTKKNSIDRIKEDFLKHELINKYLNKRYWLRWNESQTWGWYVLKDRALWSGIRTLSKNCLCSAFNGRAKPLMILHRNIKIHRIGQNHQLPGKLLITD
jgi:hypothetical protein